MLSTVILAGGRSERMGQDKAFLLYRGETFVERIAGEMSRISDDLIVVIGAKEVGPFETLLGRSARIVGDAVGPATPVTGLLTGMGESRHPFAAVLACDLPMIKSEVVDYLYRRARGHSAAIPLWSDGRVEPLCGVYRAKLALRAAVSSIKGGEMSCDSVLRNLPRVRYVEVSKLRELDPQMGSLRNINTITEYSKITSR